MVFSPAGKQLMSECELVLNTVTDDEPVRISSLDPQSSEIPKKETAAEKKARLKAEKIAAAMALWEEDYELCIISKLSCIIRINSFRLRLRSTVQ